MVCDETLVDTPFTWSDSDHCSFLVDNTFFSRVFHPDYPTLKKMNELVESTYEEIANRRGAEGLRSKEAGSGLVAPVLSLVKAEAHTCEALLSRTLIAILKGAPHAIPYGIVEVSSRYHDGISVGEAFLIEETIDTAAVYSLCQLAWEASSECRIGSLKLIDFRLKFDAFFARMKAIQVGGNFELSNIGYRKSDHFEEVFVIRTDVDRTLVNPYIPLSWENWILLNVGEENESLVCSHNLMLSRAFGAEDDEVEKAVLNLNEKKEDSDCVVS